jgi:hypothetical protein
MLVVTVPESRSKHPHLKLEFFRLGEILPPLRKLYYGVRHLWIAGNTASQHDMNFNGACGSMAMGTAMSIPPVLRLEADVIALCVSIDLIAVSPRWQQGSQGGRWHAQQAPQ